MTSRMGVFGTFYGATAKDLAAMQHLGEQAQLSTKKVEKQALTAFEVIQKAPGKYGLSDHVYFAFVAVGSALGLASNEAKMEYAVYATTCKLKAASEKYFSRTKELALEYKNLKIQQSKSELLSTTRKQKIAYWEKISPTDIEKLQEFYSYIEEDKTKTVPVARVEMLEAFENLKKFVKASAPENATEAEIYKLVAKITGGDSRGFYQQLRRAYALELLMDYSSAGFINEFTAFVEAGVEGGFGNDTEVRSDMFDMAIHFVNNPSDNDEIDISKKDLKKYLDELSKGEDNLQAFVNQLPNKMKTYFASEMQNMIDGDKQITVDTLKKLYYANEELDGQFITLQEIFNEKHQLNTLAQELEILRLSYQEIVSIVKNLNAFDYQRKTAQSAMQEQSTLMKRDDQQVQLQELASISLAQLSDDKLVEILGKEKGALVSNYRKWRTQLDTALTTEFGFVQLQGKQKERLIKLKTNEDESQKARKALKEVEESLVKNKSALLQCESNRLEFSKKLVNTIDNQEVETLAGELLENSRKITQIQSEIERYEKEKSDIEKKIEEYKKQKVKLETKLTEIQIAIGELQKDIFQKTFNNTQLKGDPQEVGKTAVGLSRNNLVQLKDYLKNKKLMEEAEGQNQLLTELTTKYQVAENEFTGSNGAFVRTLLTINDVLGKNENILSGEISFKTEPDAVDKIDLNLDKVVASGKVQDVVGTYRKRRNQERRAIAQEILDGAKTQKMIIAAENTAKARKSEAQKIERVNVVSNVVSSKPNVAIPKNTTLLVPEELNSRRITTRTINVSDTDDDYDTVNLSTEEETEVLNSDKTTSKQPGNTQKEKNKAYWQ